VTGSQCILLCLSFMMGSAMIGGAAENLFALVIMTLLWPWIAAGVLDGD